MAFASVAASSTAGAPGALRVTTPLVRLRRRGRWVSTLCLRWRAGRWMPASETPRDADLTRSCPTGGIGVGSRGRADSSLATSHAVAAACAREEWLLVRLRRRDRRLPRGSGLAPTLQGWGEPCGAESVPWAILFGTSPTHLDGGIEGTAQK